jgi:hypothetical protein
MRLTSSNKLPLPGKVCAAIGVCCLINFGVWGYLDMKNGGNALNGSVENGRYFFSEHGVQTEVSAETWRFSRVYTKVTILLFAVGAVSLLFFGAYANDARNVEPGAPPKGGLGPPPSNSGATERPPSVS